MTIEELAEMLREAAISAFHEVQNDPNARPVDAANAKLVNWLAHGAEAIVTRKKLRGNK